MLKKKYSILIELPKIGKSPLLYTIENNRKYNILRKLVFEATKELSREDTPTVSIVLPIYTNIIKRKDFIVCLY